MRTRRPITVAAASSAALVGAAAVGVRTLILRQARSRAATHREAARRAGSGCRPVWRRKKHPGPPLELLLLGDSIAAGLGAGHRRDTLGARLAKGIARAHGRSVRLHTAAVVGSETSALGGQLDGPPGRLPRGHRRHRRRRQRRHAPCSGRACGGATRSRRAHPPRWGSARRGRHLSRSGHAAGDPAAAAGPRGAVVTSTGRRSGRRGAPGGRACRRSRTSGRSGFAERPDEMFSVDRFHPSALGYGGPQTHSSPRFSPP